MSCLDNNNEKNISFFFWFFLKPNDMDIKRDMDVVVWGFILVISFFILKESLLISRRL